MKRAITTITRALLTAGTLVAMFLAVPRQIQANATSTNIRVIEEYGRLPLAFEENRGQTDAQVRFLSRGSGYSLFLTPREVVLRLRAGETRKSREELIRDETADPPERGPDAVLRMSLVGAKDSPEVTGVTELPGRSHYFKGNDPSAWQSGIPSYKRVRYHEVYPGIDVEYYGNQRQLEYDFVIQPVADPSLIRLRFEGAEELRMDESGNLIVKTTIGELIEKAPVVYQEVDGTRRAVEGRYVRYGEEEIGFEIVDYDHRARLTIDPVLVYSTYLGGDANDSGYAIAVDGVGSAYVTGETWSTDFPTQGEYSTNPDGTNDVFVTKLSPDGQSLVYSTYLGGNTSDYGDGIAVDETGSACVTGNTNALDFPTMNPSQADCGGATDAFVTKLSPDGSSLLYSTYLGGSDYDLGRAIAVDESGSAYLTGRTRSTDFPTQNAYESDYQGGSDDAFVTKISPDGSSLVYSTYLGGGGWDYGLAIAVDVVGSAYVAGETFSSNFPTQAPYQADQVGPDAFVSKLSVDGISLVYSTYLGGDSWDDASGIAVDAEGSVYITGDTSSSDFPTLNPCQYAQGLTDAFVTKLSPSGGLLVYSTYLGGTGSDYGASVAVDFAGSAYVVGRTDSSDFPTEGPFQTHQGGADVFVTILTPSGNPIAYSTYLGGDNSDWGRGIAVDAEGGVYITGATSSSNFPTLNPYQTDQANTDAFVTKLATRYQLNLDLASILNGSGQVEAVPAGGTCSNTPGASEHCEYWYNEGTDVTLDATPASDSVFAGWGGDCSGANPCTVTMNADLSVTADFRGPCITPPTFGGITGATESSVGTCSIDLGWTAATPVCGTDVTYSVYRSTSSGFTPDSTTRIASNVTGTTYTDTAGLAGSGTYYYVVRAADVSNGAEDTNMIDLSVTLSACASTAPESVQFFNVCAKNGENVLNWVNPVAGFGYTQLLYSTSGYPADPTDGTLVTSSAASAGDVESFVHAVPNDVTYYYTAFVNGPTGWETTGKTSSGRPADDSGPVKWGYTTDAVTLATVGVIPNASYHAVSNDRVVHGMAPGAAGGMWPSGWRPFAMNQPSQSRPTVFPLRGTTVGGASIVGLVASQDGRVCAFNAETGALLWASPVLGGTLQAAVSASLRDWGGTYDLVMVGTRDAAPADNVFYALNLVDGTVAWSFDNGGGGNGIGLIASQATIDAANNRVYFSSEVHATGSTHTVWALSFTDTGASYLWSREFNYGSGPEDVDASPILAGGRLYVGTSASRVHVLDPLDGSESWWPAYDAGDGAVKGYVWPDVANDQLYFSTDGNVHGLDMTTGLAAWPAVPVPNASWLLLWNGKIYVGGGSGMLWEIDAVSGPALVRSVNVGSPAVIVGNPTYDNRTGLLVVGTSSGVIYGVAPPFP